MMNYGEKATTSTEPKYSGEEIRNPRRESSIAAYVENTAKALKEANLALDDVVSCMFGPRHEKMSEQPREPIESLEQQMAMNAEIAIVTANRICELRARIFG